MATCFTLKSFALFEAKKTPKKPTKTRKTAKMKLVNMAPAQGWHANPNSETPETFKKYVSQRHFLCHRSALPVRVDDVRSRHDCGGDVRRGGVGAATEVVTSCMHRSDDVTSHNESRDSGRGVGFVKVWIKCNFCSKSSNLIVNCGPTVTMIAVQPVPGKYYWDRSDMGRNFVKKNIRDITLWRNF